MQQMFKMCDHKIAQSTVKKMQLSLGKAGIQIGNLVTVPRGTGMQSNCLHNCEQFVDQNPHWELVTGFSLHQRTDKKVVVATAHTVVRNKVTGEYKCCTKHDADTTTFFVELIGRPAFYRIVGAKKMPAAPHNPRHIVAVYNMEFPSSGDPLPIVSDVAMLESVQAIQHHFNLTPTSLVAASILLWEAVTANQPHDFAAVA
jgi:hypothetical protein